ncbi:MAG: hypothetical protein MK289_15340 [Trichodesmium sp. ALOHA_ZT_67]|nr:hypothetical protein [Trichodesmium sp. ALOHA_ZT_67]
MKQIVIVQKLDNLFFAPCWLLVPLQGNQKIKTQGIIANALSKKFT